MQRLLEAARSLDTGTVARTVRELMDDHGVAEVWTRVCVPALHHVTGDVAVEHALSQGVAHGLDLVSAPRHDDIRTNHVLLACAPREAHSLPLRALAAALFERRIGTFLLGAEVPWSALRAAVHCTVPGTAIVWSQQPGTADPAMLLALAARFPATRFAVAGPGWDPAPAGLPHLTSIEDAVSACVPVAAGRPPDADW
ncbi:transcriptional regulator [Dactylosporangium sp. CA-152071]|uniref:transcriptional regulator n=1 Tax=Dactylosporangium sp. CA-152071 TaxID=3239933 RepID=UPI003D92F999